jgi:hypothetical protein
MTGLVFDRFQAREVQYAPNTGAEGKPHFFNIFIAGDAIGSTG